MNEPTWDNCAICQRHFEDNPFLQLKVRSAEHFEHEGAGWEVADEYMRPYHASGHAESGYHGNRVAHGC